MKLYYTIACLFIFGAVSLGCTQNNPKNSMDSMNMEKSLNEGMEFRKMCQDAGYEWMLMKPTKDGRIIRDSQECMGCMAEGIEHICDKEKFMDYYEVK